MATRSASRRGDSSLTSVSYDAGVPILTVTFGSADGVDVDEVAEGVVLFFDGAELGRLVRLQALIPEEPTTAWLMLVADCLGPTVGSRCTALVEHEEDVLLEDIRVPAPEWASLRTVQWPGLHRSWRASLGMPTLPSPARRPSAAPIESLVVASAGVQPSGPPARFDCTVELPPAFAERCGVDGAIAVTLEGGAARLVARARPGARPGLELLLLQPEARSDRPARLRPSRAGLVAEIPLQEPVDAYCATPVLLRVALAAPAAGEETHPEFRYIAHGAKGARTWFGGREEVAGGVHYAGIRMSRSADRIYWRTTGKPPVEVRIVREGGELWARGFAKKARHAQRVRVTCVLRPEALERLQPDGRNDPAAAHLQAEGTVDRDGFFQLRLASVRTARFAGEIVERLDLEVG